MVMAADAPPVTALQAVKVVWSRTNCVLDDVVGLDEPVECVTPP